MARLLFAPLEEASATEFSLLFASIGDERSAGDDGPSETPKGFTGGRSPSDAAQRAPLLSGRGGAAASSPSASALSAHSSSAQRARSAYSAAALYLAVLLKLLLLISLTLLCFAPPFALPFIDVLYGAKWSRTDAPWVLSVYTGYIGFMALNGLSEAFVTAVTTAAQMRLYNALLLAFSAVYLSACALLLPLGAVGLIAANCLNMAMRIAYSATFIHRFFTRARHVDAAQREAFPRQIAAQAAPASAVWLTAMGSAALCHASFTVFDVQNAAAGLQGGAGALPAYAPHVAVGALAASLLLAVVWNHERTFLAQLRHTLSKRSRQNDTAEHRDDDNDHQMTPLSADS